MPDDKLMDRDGLADRLEDAATHVDTEDWEHRALLAEAAAALRDLAAQGLRRERVIEECAKIAEGFGSAVPCPQHGPEATYQLRGSDVAKAIRSLSQRPEGQQNAVPQAPCEPCLSSSGLAERPDSTNAVSPLSVAGTLNERDSLIKPAGTAPDEQRPEGEGGLKHQLASDIADAATESYAPHVTEHGEKSQAPFLTAEQLFRNSSTAPAEAVKMVPLAVGVSRMFDNEKAVLVSFERRPTDDELRNLHEGLAGRAAAPERGEGSKQ